MPEKAHLNDSTSAEPSRPVAFTTVFDEEIGVIKNSRLERGVSTDKLPDSLVGLAFSGGGIRSATFNLGFLQALARKGLIQKFDYLSTVSGGGYIGSWLAACTNRLGFGEVKKALDCKPYAIGKPGDPAESAEHPAVRWLRNYSDYLTPRVGVFTGDAGAVVGSWLRNVLLNQLVLALFLLGVILIPLAFVLFTKSVLQDHPTRVFFVGIALLFFATIVIANCMVPEDNYQKRGWFLRNSVRLGVLMPLLAAAWLMNSGMLGWQDASNIPVGYWVLGGALIYFAIWAVAAFIASNKRKKEAIAPGQSVEVVSWQTLVLTAFGAGALGGFFMMRYTLYFAPIAQKSTGNHWTLIIFGTVMVVLLMLLGGVLQLGLLGRGCVDLVREWWARVGGSLILSVLAWLLIFGIVVFGPLAVRVLLNTKIGTGLNLSALLTWLASIPGGIGAGKSPQTSGQSKAADGSSKVTALLKSQPVKEVVAKVAPYVFLVGLLVILSTVVHYVVGLCFAAEKTRELWSHSLLRPEVWSMYWAIQDSAKWTYVFLAAVVLILLAAILSWRVDVNDFSMHHFYRNRLVRCYLGAARNRDRKPQDFTGFDPDDEIALASLIQSKSADPKSRSYPGLYPILNGTLNVTRGGELGFQKRKAKPFIFTPLYCGYDVDSYLPTALGRKDKLGHPQGIMLGTAMAISGAAVSPNMGYHTSPATAFFLTLFDVRLGWWMGNPRYVDKWKSPGPPLGLGYLLSELLGSCDEKSKYVYLSDGAHFENLAIYELIKRRCRLILACDCGEDGSYVFSDLMGAIEKARTDFGVDIRIDVSKIRPVAAARESESSYAVAKIHYGAEDDCGILIYVKASLPKDAAQASPDVRTPSDVVSYAQAHSCFPHQSTGDQWFDEVQFESYRALGEYIGKMVVNDTNLGAKLAAVLTGQIKSCTEIDKA